jgi:hypothetical protein
MYTSQNIKYAILKRKKTQRSKTRNEKNNATDNKEIQWLIRDYQE